MPSKHSKKLDDRHHFSYHEKAGMGTIHQRLGVESQLPFGYCCLSLNPSEEAVVSPSGHLYSREAILEYLLLKTKDLKNQQRLYEDQQHNDEREQRLQLNQQKSLEITNFAETQDVGGIAKRKASEIESKLSYMESRKKVIDDTDSSVKREQLKKISPWIVDFTPTAKDARVKIPPRRPSSPFSGQPLRTKDLIPVNLEREEVDATSGDAGSMRFICPVSR